MTVRSLAETWGTTASERALAFPCDALPVEADDVLYRGVSVHAPAPVVFRWLCQLRAAPYSYDWIDNFGQRSPARLIPGLEELAVGQQVMGIFTLARLNPGSRPSGDQRAARWLAQDLVGQLHAERRLAGVRLRKRSRAPRVRVRVP